MGSVTWGKKIDVTLEDEEDVKRISIKEITIKLYLAFHFDELFPRDIEVVNVSVNPRIVLTDDHSTENTSWREYS